MAVAEVYQPSHIKRSRATRAEVEHRREKFFEIIAEMRPMTVRQVFYQATVRGIIEKTEAGYNKVQTDLGGRVSCPTIGSPTTPGGSASRASSAALSTHLRRRHASIARPCVTISTPMPKSGSRRTRSRVWSTR
jgi:hypothetical protein